MGASGRRTVICAIMGLPQNERTCNFLMSILVFCAKKNPEKCGLFTIQP